MTSLTKSSILLPVMTAICCVWFPQAVAAQSRPKKPVRVPASSPDIIAFKNSINVGGTSTPVTGVRVSLKSHSLGIGVAEKGQDGDTLVGFQSRYEAAAVLSGGFLKSFYPPTPLGLVKNDNVVLNRGVQSDLLTGLLLANKRSVMIVSYTDSQCTSAWSECLQSGPLLVSEGRSALPPPNEVHLQSTLAAIDGRYQRAFVALLPDGQVVLAITGEITLPALQDFLVRAPEHGGLGCTSAINLSGGGSAGLLTRIAAERTSTGTVDIFLPNSIVVH